MKGTLIGTPIPFQTGQSINSLFRGQVELPDGSVKSCILKNIPRVEIINEIISATLASSLGLPVPEVIMTFVDNQIDPNGYFVKCPAAKNGRLVFATVDVQVPNLAQRISSAHLIEQQIIQHYLLKWAQKGDLYGFDAWVANTDRHRGNVLLSSNGKIWLIDHGRSFIKDDWTPQELEPNKIYQSRLSEWYTVLMPTAMRIQTKLDVRGTQARIKALKLPNILTSVFALGMAHDAEKRAIMNFLDQRTSRVAADAATAL